MVRWVLALVAACRFSPSTKPDNDSAPHDDSLPPADASHDAMSVLLPPSIVIEAESYTTKHDSSTEAWSPATAIPSYSGTSYMQCGPDLGAYCPNDANLPPCAASMTYDLPITTARAQCHTRAHRPAADRDRHRDSYRQGRRRHARRQLA